MRYFREAYPSVNPFDVRAFLVGWGKIDSRMQNDEGSFGMEVLFAKGINRCPLCR